MIIKPVVTEKTSKLLSSYCYVFIVDSGSTKIQLSKIFFKKYKVKPLKINICKKFSKKVRKGRIIGSTKEQKKAYVYFGQSVPELGGTA
jgi:large subunit ribosomal protein L23